MKVNALTDEAIIEELYQASQKAPRSTSSLGASGALRPGVEGPSETIRVRSVWGRFLEHSRVFHFQAGKKSSYLIGSPDLMPRNLDHRLEILAPVDDQAVQAAPRPRSRCCWPTTRSRGARRRRQRNRRRPKKDEPSRASQLVFMRRARPRPVRRLVPTHGAATRSRKR